MSHDVSALFPGSGHDLVSDLQHNISIIAHSMILSPQSSCYILDNPFSSEKLPFVIDDDEALLWHVMDLVARSIFRSAINAVVKICRAI